VTIGVPTALALVGTTLAAIAAFGPFRTKPKAVAQATWPTLIEPTAVACEPLVRIDLAEALGRLQSPWSEAILRQAHANEPDPTVRAVIASLLPVVIPSEGSRAANPFDFAQGRLRRGTATDVHDCGCPSTSSG
jgi:hypothetical protein